jgi:hypothetical protein
MVAAISRAAAALAASAADERLEGRGQQLRLVGESEADADLPPVDGQQAALGGESGH